MLEDDTKDWPRAMFHGQENPQPVHPAVYRLVVERAAEAGLKRSLMQWRDGGPVWGSVSLPDGDGQRAMDVDRDNAESWEQVTFEQWHLIDGYEAVWDRSESKITAAVTLTGGTTNFNRIRGVELVEPGHAYKGFSLRVATSDARLSMTLVQPIPDELQVFTRVRRDAALVIEGVRAACHDEATRILADLALPFFIDLSISGDVVCGLTRHRAYASDGRDERPQIISQLRFPVTQYNRDAASLYLYARSLTLGPVMFRYLAFFQVIEFFAPVHARAELVTRLRNAIKDPSFNPSDDAALGRVVTMLTGGGRNAMSDREQVITTIRACVQEEDLVAWLGGRPVASKALADKSRMAGVRIIQPRDKNSSIVAQAADRIYDLRCRIVHAKEDGSYVEPLRLFEVNSDKVLVHDLELVRFVAERVLVASSRPASWF